MADVAPDLVLHGGDVVTLDGARPQAETVAMRGGYIQAVGDNDSILARATAASEVIDLGGRTMVPGFNDVHAHMDGEGLKQLRPSLAGARSIADILEIVAALVRGTPSGDWIVNPAGRLPALLLAVGRKHRPSAACRRARRLTLRLRTTRSASVPCSQSGGCVPSQERRGIHLPSHTRAGVPHNRTQT